MSDILLRGASSARVSSSLHQLVCRIKEASAGGAHHISGNKMSECVNFINSPEVESVYLVRQFLFSFSVATPDWPLHVVVFLSLAIQSRSDSKIII